MNRDQSQSLLIRAMLKDCCYTISLAMLIMAFALQPVAALANVTGAPMRLPAMPKIAANTSAATAVFFAGTTCASPGKDGSGTITGVVNTYYVGGTALGTTVTLGTLRSGGSATTIAAGDLILIIQMQDGASVNFTNTAFYGSGVSPTVGRYEYATVSSVSGSTLTLTSSLANTYTQNISNRQTFQVVRVPQYSSATASSVTAAAWDGTTGGIVALDVTGTLSLSATSIDVSGKGFRGGAGLQKTGGALPVSAGVTDYYYPSSSPFNGIKGEGTAGTPPTVASPAGTANISTGIDTYTNGSIGRGAPGNAGGGSDDYAPGVDNGLNAGGGGGGNAGAGGQGGNSWHNNLAINNSPVGFVQGGLGGAAATNSTTQIVMGGGGGAGDGNNSTTANQYLMNGAHGGGIVLVRAGNISGTGTIKANGNAALDLPNDSVTQTDAGGGGGAGGSVVISVVNGTGAGLTINANGGKGGNSGYRQHGPGGGGGGGFVAAPSGATTTVTGGTSGLDVLGAKYNATDGTAGLATLSGTPFGTGGGASCLPNLTVTKSVASGGPAVAPTTATYTIAVQNAAGAGLAKQVRISDLQLPAGFTYASAGAFTTSAGVNLTGTTTAATLAGLSTKPTVGTRALNWGDIDIPEGGSISITFTVNIAAGTANGTYHNPATVSYLDPTRSTATRVVKPATNATNSTANGGTAFTTNTTYQTGGFTNVVGSNYDGTSAGPSTEDFVITTAPILTVVKSCPTPATCETASQAPGTDLTYRIVFTNVGGNPAQSLVIVDPIPINTDFKLSSVTTTTGATGLTFVVEYSSDYNAATPSAATWTYVPSSGAGGAPAGYDRNAKAIRWRVTAGNLSQTSPNNTGSMGFTVSIR